MALTDTHTHLYYETDDLKRVGLVQRAINNGIDRLFLPNVDSSTIDQVFGMAASYPQNCFPMAGLHPCEVKHPPEGKTGNYKDELAAVYEAAKDSRTVAIGEIGIDLYWDRSTLDIQKDAFVIQIAWALELDLPIVIHSRDSFDEVYDVLLQKKQDKLRGIFHCFTGSLLQAEKIIELGFMLGIGGVITYKNSGLDQVVKELDLRYIVLETDSPYLAPVPYRGKQNESSYLVYIAEKVAGLHEISVDEVARITTENSVKIFGV